MTNRVLLGITLTVVVTLIVAFPAIADAITGLKQTEIKVKNNEIQKLRFQLSGLVEKQPFGGYAILTESGTAVAVTSHAGFYDSEKQTPPTTPVIDFPGPAALCSTTGPECGSEWHVHIVEPVANDACATGLAVGELTFEEPSNKLNIAGANLIARGIAIGDAEFTAALSGDVRDFSVGTPLEGGLAFDLTPIFADVNDPTTLQVVCIGPAADSE